MYVLDMVRLYWPMGSARAPDTAGPTTRPRLKAQVMRDMLRACVRLVEDSDMMALIVPTAPGREKRDG